MNKLDDAIKYFQKDKGFDRFFQKLKIKYLSYDRKTPGSITITNVKDFEKYTLGVFMKKDYTLNKSITIKLENIQIRINETKFEGIELKDIIEGYFDEEIKSNKRKKSEFDIYYNNFIASLISKYAVNAELENLINNIFISNNSNTIWIKNSFKNDKDKTEICVNDVFISIMLLPVKKEKLPVFCSRVFKNPHQLDKNNFYQKMFNIFIINLYNIRTSEDISILNLENKSIIYYYFNLYIDDVSNMVLCKNVIAKKNNDIHQGWKGFFDKNELMQITLTNLFLIDEVDIMFDFVIVVENPSVFTSLIDNFGDKRIPIICTYGQIKLSALILLDLLKNKCSTIFYSGDIDPEGILIADKLKTKYKDKIKFIGFDKETYINNLSNVVISEIRINKLKKVFNNELKIISDELVKIKKASYEEENIDMITKEIFNLLNNE